MGTSFNALFQLWFRTVAVGYNRDFHHANVAFAANHVRTVYGYDGGMRVRIPVFVMNQHDLIDAVFRTRGLAKEFGAHVTIFRRCLVPRVPGHDQQGHLPPGTTSP